ncbi:hypothetical protein D3C75_980990 [compost metagenome]
MVGAQLQRLVDRGDIAHALVQDIDGLVHHRHQDAVDDEGGEVFGFGGDLAQALGEGDGGFIGGGRGGDAAHDLDQLHRRRRLHEVQADETIRPVADRGQAGDRNGRGVGGQQGVRTQVRQKIDKDRLLDGFVFGRRLDDQIGLGRLGQGGDGADAGQGRVGLGRGRQAARRAPRQAGRDLAEGQRNPLGRQVVEPHLIAAGGHRLSDA